MEFFLIVIDDDGFFRTLAKGDFLAQAPLNDDGAPSLREDDVDYAVRAALIAKAAKKKANT